MMLTPFIMSSYATNLAFAGAGNALGAMDARTALADSVTGNESQADVADIAARDRALSLDSAKSWIDFEVSQRLQKHAQAMKKKDLEQQRRLMDEDGVIFG